MQRRLSRARWAGQVKQNLDGRREVRQSLTPIRRTQSRNESAALCNEITFSPSVSISPQRPPTYSLTDRLTTLMRAERAEGDTWMEGTNCGGSSSPLPNGCPRISYRYVRPSVARSTGRLIVADDERGEEFFLR